MVRQHLTCKKLQQQHQQDRKSTRLNSSHVSNSYAVFCLKKKTKKHYARRVQGTLASECASAPATIRTDETKPHCPKWPMDTLFAKAHEPNARPSLPREPT